MQQYAPPPTDTSRYVTERAFALRANKGAESLGLDFTVTLESFGVKEVAELLPGGKDMAVTDDNKERYLQVTCWTGKDLDWRLPSCVVLRVLRVLFVCGFGTQHIQTQHSPTAQLSSSRPDLGKQS